MFIKRCSRNLPWLHQNLIFEQEQKKSENLLFQYLTEPFKTSRGGPRGWTWVQSLPAENFFFACFPGLSSCLQFLTPKIWPRSSIDDVTVRKRFVRTLQSYIMDVLFRSSLLRVGKRLRALKEASVISEPFPSSLVPLFQNESKCETFHMKMSSACSFIFMHKSFS